MFCMFDMIWLGAPPVLLVAILTVNAFSPTPKLFSPCIACCVVITSKYSQNPYPLEVTDPGSRTRWNDFQCPECAQKFLDLLVRQMIGQTSDERFTGTLRYRISHTKNIQIELRQWLQICRHQLRLEIVWPPDSNDGCSCAVVILHAV